jgi:hypothetical protein
MKAVADGFWGTAHFTLEMIGRGAVRILPARTSASLRKDREEIYAMTGGAALGVVFGAILGLVLSDESHAMTALTGAMICGLAGIWTGIISGAIVQTTDDAIHEWLNSVKSE